jgi:hypothetical protein
LIIGDMLVEMVHNELIQIEDPLSAADNAFVGQLSASAAVQHLLLLLMAFCCQRRHKQQQGLSHFKAKEAIAVVTGRQRAAAAAAAEATNGSSCSSSSSGAVIQQQQQYPAVPAHHTAVLELLLVPEHNLTFPLPSNEDQLEVVLTTFTELVLGVFKSIPGRREYGLPKVPVELCAPLHCMLAEAAALAPGSVYSLRAVLVLMQALQDVYFKVSQFHSQCNSQVTVNLNQDDDYC